MVTANNCFWRLEMSLFLIPNCWRVGCCCGSASVCICVCACVCALFVGVLVRANTHPGTCVAVLLFLPLCLFFPLPPTPPSPPTPLLYFPLAENIGGQKKKKILEDAEIRAELLCQRAAQEQARTGVSFPIHFTQRHLCHRQSILLPVAPQTVLGVEWW